MTVRQKRIWDLLVGESFLTAKEIGHHLHISDRTVRSDIKEINGERGREVILSKKGQGYYIEEPEPFWDMRAAGELENEENLEWEMIRRILFTGEVPYLELADEMYVSDTFLSKIVGRVNRRMAGRMRNGGIRKKKGCLVLELEEEEKRNYYNVYITTKNLNQFFEPESFSPYFEWVDICWIKELVLEKLGSRRNQFFDATIMRLVVEVGVMAERMAAGCYIQKEPSGQYREVRELIGSKEDKGQRQGREADEKPEPALTSVWGRDQKAEGQAWKQAQDQETRDIARDMMNAIEKELDIQAPPEEYRYLQQLLRNDFYYREGPDDGLAGGILGEILQGITLEYGYDLSGDEEFCQEMMSQIIGTLRRAENRQMKLNPILYRIKAQYPLEYDMAIFFADRFNHLTGTVVSEDEVGFFAIHIIRAMEARMMRGTKKVALVNPFGKPVKELIRKRLEEMGECRITIGASYSVFHMPASFPKDILAVLTTVPLETACEDVPVILCRNFLDYHEKEKLLTIMRQEEVSSVQSFYKRLFHPSLFFPELEASSPREALEFLSSQLERQGYVNHTFLESVLGREEVAPTVFENGFVISHAMENTAVRSAICVGILKERIPWGDCNVKMVFLLALAPNWNQNMAPVYNVMISSMMKPGTMRQLSRIKDCKAFVNHLLS